MPAITLSTNLYPPAVTARDLPGLLRKVDCSADCRGSTAVMNIVSKRLLGGALAGALVLVAPACGDDEDGDGGTTDEEIEDVQDTAEDLQDEAEDTVDSLGNEVEEEVDSQDEGSDEDGE